MVVDVERDAADRPSEAEISNSVAEFGRVVDVLLSESNPGKLRDAAAALREFYASLSGLSDASGGSPGDKATFLPSGRAISPGDAARCVLDFARTSEFLRGIVAAVREARLRFAGRPIEIVYAGCGPFAALAVPLTTKFTVDEIRFTLIDIHAHALACARRVFRGLGAEDFVRAYVQADAAAYAHPPPNPFQVLITETMQRALEKEPQVAITLNLVPQLCAGGILIPERISVDACLYDPATEFSKGQTDGGLESVHGAGRRTRIELGTLLELTAATARDYGRWSPDIGHSPLPVTTLTVPPDTPRNLSVMLRTTVTIFGSNAVDEYDSGLTCPVTLHELGGAGGGSRVAFEYAMGRRPGFACRWTT